MSINGVNPAGILTRYGTGKTSGSISGNMSENAEDFMRTAVEKAESRAAENETEKSGTAADKAAEYAEKAFDFVGSKAPAEVKRAWMAAAKEAGANGLGIGSNGMMTHISQMMTQRLKKTLLGGNADDNNILGSSVSSALQAARQALYDLENPLVPDHTRSMEVQRHRMKEKAFYQAFIQKLEEL